MPIPSLDPIRTLASKIECFEASRSIAHTGTGSRREGERFEHLIVTFWEALSNIATGGGAQSSVVRSESDSKSLYAKLDVGCRTLLIPVAKSADRQYAKNQHRWLEITFRVSELIARFPSEEEAIRRYAPKEGRYSNDKYPNIYRDLTTEFDGTIVLVKNGILHEKILLEYKTAKSSEKVRIDGNAHERLSFQIMQYLEVATRYTKCSLVVMSNGAFVRYRNKYHVNFHVQADRLRNFSWFSMDHVCTAIEYSEFAKSLLAWLFDGSERVSGAPS